jgi:hypothetical protein
MRRVKRTKLDQLMSFYPFACDHCGNRESRFRLTASAIVRLLILCAVPAGAWLWKHPPAFLNRADNAVNTTSQQDQSEALARARTAAGGQLSTFENLMLRKQKIAMDNATVTKLVKANVGKDVILQMIRTSAADYDVSASAVIELKQGGVDQAIILAMIAASYAIH